MALDNDVRTTRRGVLAAAVGGAGAAPVSRIARPEHAAAADNGTALIRVPNPSGRGSFVSGPESSDLEPVPKVEPRIAVTVGAAPRPC